MVHVLEQISIIGCLNLWFLWLFVVNAPRNWQLPKQGKTVACDWILQVDIPIFVLAMD